MAPAWQVSRGSCRQVLQLGSLGKLWNSRERIKVKEGLRTDGKNRQELTFDRCQEISLEVPLPGHPASLSSSLLILCSPWRTFGNENRTAGEGHWNHTAPSQCFSRTMSAHAESCCHLTSPIPLKNTPDGIHTIDIPTPKEN